MFADQLNRILDDLYLLRFEGLLMAGALVLLTAGLVTRHHLVSRGLFVAVLMIALFWIVPTDQTIVGFGGAVSLDSLGTILRLLFVISAVWVVFFPGAHRQQPEFYFLILALISGSALMLSANHLLLIYLAVELTSFAAYLLTNFNFQKRSFEAGFKYLLFGGVSSAIALYGASLIYGFGGSLTFTELDFGSHSEAGLLYFGIVAFMGGLLFKISLVPFHLWVPGTYQEAPTATLPILASLPKIGALVVLHRLMLAINGHDQYWMMALLQVIGILTIALGTLGALRQTNAKRLIAYGAIAHSGFLLASLLVPGVVGSVAFAWYAVIYTIMNLATFYLVAIFEHTGPEVSDFAGLGRAMPYMGVLVVVAMVALVGLPPTAGFTAKFYLFSVMWSRYQEISDPLMLAYLGVAVLSVVFSLFFYLKIPYYLFLQEKGEITTKRPVFTQHFLATIFIGALLWLFFSPSLLNNIAENIKFIAW